MIGQMLERSWIRAFQRTYGLVDKPNGDLSQRECRDLTPRDPRVKKNTEGAETIRLSGRWRDGYEEEIGDCVAKLGQRGGGVDLHAQLRPVVQAFGEVRAERSQLVDHPFVVAHRHRVVANAFV